MWNHLADSQQHPVEILLIGYLHTESYTAIIQRGVHFEKTVFCEGISQKNIHTPVTQEAQAVWKRNHVQLKTQNETTTQGPHRETKGQTLTWEICQKEVWVIPKIVLQIPSHQDLSKNLWNCIP